MSGFDSLVPGFKEKVKIAEEIVEAAPDKKKARETLNEGMTREQAIKYGQALGESEAERRRETGEERDIRIRRAMAYAAWEFDGRPPGMIGKHLREFEVEMNLTDSLYRGASQPIKKKEKK